MKKLIVTVFFIAYHLILTPLLHAQTGDSHGDIMRQNGMLYVVIGVLIILFIGLLVYLWTLDRRLNKLEQQQNSSTNE